MLSKQTTTNWSVKRMESEWGDRWSHLKKILERSGPFTHSDFEPSPETLIFLQETFRILIVGAGGLGCELLKNLALLGVGNIDIIDMDIIDISNLNRQFLFRPKDVGKSKAEVAAEFINTRIPNCKVKPHFTKIQDFPDSFYQQFHVVVCGLDSIVARRWMNRMLISLLNYEDGILDQASVIPMVDGGTEGFKGNARVIFPGMSACIECTLDFYPPQINFPLCTIAHTPRLPEHCIEYVRLLLWPKQEPFGANVVIDGDDPQHIKWIYEKSLDRANEFNILGVTYRLTQGVVKRIIPAVASTNAVIAAACATEVLKITTSCCMPLNNYVNFTDTDGVYTYPFEAEKKEDCLACSLIPQTLTFSEDSKLRDIYDYLIESAAYQMKSPGITTVIDGKSKTLYMKSVKSIEVKTRDNLKKTLKELGLTNGQEIYVADQTTPTSITFKLNLTSHMEK
ncbi:NEDD8-activating enzyme E1 catalytic subunit isoform X1 [Octopus sinensis]|uniref:NEDD8-activating enzyme E1 catalytic subunit n=2 Tax=Octopus sinensis TaxID=2607531 RepID=A0A6P7SAL6_9MOLL|nr:NEDD8-activating enzyme E1 catalytic subunit isoform X1 [Octopus sinensis]